jgi:hypothetical protein
MARKSIKRALTTVILVAASLGVGIGAAAQPASAAAKPVGPAGVFLCYPMYKTIPDSQLGNYDVITILSTWVSGGVRYDYIYYYTNQALQGIVPRDRARGHRSCRAYARLRDRPEPRTASNQ